MSVTIRQLGAQDAAAFEAALAIYRTAIDPSEQRPEDELRAALGRADYLMLAAERDNRVIGFSIGWHPGDFWLFEYMAILPEERGRGIGASLFRMAVSHANGGAGIIEAEAARDDLTARRLRFYARLGCRRIGDLDYLLPLRTHGLPPPMLLLAHSASPSLEKAQLRTWLQRIFTGVYHQAPDDPRIDEMLGDAPSNVPLVDL